MQTILDHIQRMADDHWPLCVAVMAALLLVGAWVEGGTVMVP